MDSHETLLAHARPTAETVELPAKRERSTLLLGRYRILARLGAGGFGVVWHAHDEQLDREVAVKRIALPPMDLDTDGARHGERAAREAQAAARLQHPAIVALYEARAEQDAFYLVSELVRGDTLAELIEAGSLADEELLEIGLALSDALEHAHERGVIHRDVKPQNVLVPDDPAPREEIAKLTDFGGAWMAGEQALTRTGDVLGTLAYMAPEQSEGHEVDEAVDLYALALVLYEGLSGVNPVRGPTPAATARRIGHRIPPLEQRRADLPRQLTRALDRALEPLPGERGELFELHDALEDALAHGLRPRSRRLIAPRRAPRREALVPPGEGAFAPVGRSPRGLLGARWHEPHGRELLGQELYGDDLHTQPPGASAPERLGRLAGALPAGALTAAACAWLPGPAPLPAGLAGALAALLVGALPRLGWWACAAALIVSQLAVGHSGVALLLFAATLPVAPLLGRAGPEWSGPALAPLLGLAGLAGAFPALAGQASRWRARAALGALGYWWLLLAEPLLGRRLWLGRPAGIPARHVWEGSLNATAVHVLAPLLDLGLLFGASLWAGAALLLPWIVRGRSAAVDLIATTVWSAALIAAAPLLDRGLSSTVAAAGPRGVLLGGLLGGLLAMVLRALRGPL